MLIPTPILTASKEILMLIRIPPLFMANINRVIGMLTVSPHTVGQIMMKAKMLPELMLSLTMMPKPLVYKP